MGKRDKNREKPAARHRMPRNFVPALVRDRRRWYNKIKKNRACGAKGVTDYETKAVGGIGYGYGAAILCVAATGSDPARGSDTSAAAAMLSSKLFFDGAAHIVHFLKEKPGTSLCCPGAAAQTAQEWPGPWTIVTVKHGRSSASLAASPLSPDNGVREYSSGVGRSAAEQRNVKVGREPWYACARSAGDCFIRCRSRRPCVWPAYGSIKVPQFYMLNSMKRCGPVLRGLHLLLCLLLCLSSKISKIPDNGPGACGLSAQSTMSCAVMAFPMQPKARLVSTAWKSGFRLRYRKRQHW